MKMAYRTSDQKNNDMDIAVSHEEGENPHDPIIAIFSDGTKKEIVAMTTKHFLEMKAAAVGSGGSGGGDDIWSGEHVASKHRLAVRKRPDRGLLISLFEQSLQVCQANVDWFESDEFRRNSRPAGEKKYAVPNTMEAIKAASTLMTVVAKSYASNKIEKAQLYQLRDEHLTAAGLSKTVPGRSRPKAKAKTQPKAKAKSNEAKSTEAEEIPKRASRTRAKRTAKRAKTQDGNASDELDEGVEEDDREKEEEEQQEEDEGGGEG